METKHWTELISDKKTRQKAAIPQDWILGNIPPRETLDVIDFPERSNLLSEREIEITNSEVGTLLELLANGSWSALEVTIAFAKRAVIAHQLVSSVQVPVNFYSNKRTQPRLTVSLKFLLNVQRHEPLNWMNISRQLERL